MKKIIAILLMLVMLPASLAEGYTVIDGQQTVDIQDIATTTVKTMIDQQQCICQCPINPPQPPRQEPQIDVVFVIDSTGSMSDEIRTVQSHIVKIVKDVEMGRPRPNLRVGIVTYRDHKLEEYEYLYRDHQLTSDIDEVLDFLVRIEANGGGDHPEAVADGLYVALNRMNWNRGAKKVIFLIGDAAPHGVGSSDNSYYQGCPDGHDYKEAIQTAKQNGIVIYTISGSGIDSAGIRVWKDIASMTGGRYEKLSYVRQDVDQYYAAQGIDPRWAAEAKDDADYEEESNSILTNSLGVFAKKAMVAEAASIGVSYDSADEDSGDGLDVLTGNTIYSGEGSKDNGINSFFSSVFDRIVFWK